MTPTKPTDAPAQVERCGVCHEWGPPILHSRLRVWLPKDGPHTFGPYCPSCEEKAIAVARREGWRFKRIEAQP